MSRVFNKVASSFRLSIVSTSKCGGNSSVSISTLSDSSLKWKQKGIMTLLQQSLAKSFFGGFLNRNCGCVGEFARFSTNSRLSSTPQTKTVASTTPTQREKDDDRPRTGVVSDLDKGKEPKSGQVFKHARHNMYVCWHPEVPFPYEMTKPIDMNAPVTDSYLKIQSLMPVKEAFRKKHHKLTIQELVKLTYSTKHRFYGKFGKQKRDVYRAMDPNKEKRNREYL